MILLDAAEVLPVGPETQEHRHEVVEGGDARAALLDHRPIQVEGGEEEAREEREGGGHRGVVPI